MLEINCIKKTFNAGTINEKKALNGVTLKLEEGDFCTVIGGNGSGKSTTLNAVAGVWPVDSGSIKIGGVDVTGLCEHKRAKYLRLESCEPCLLVYMHEESPYRWIIWTHLILNHLRHANHTTWAR